MPKQSSSNHACNILSDLFVHQTRNSITSARFPCDLIRIAIVYAICTHLKVWVMASDHTSKWVNKFIIMRFKV